MDNLIQKLPLIFWLVLIPSVSAMAGSMNPDSWSVYVDEHNQVWSVLENIDQDLSYNIPRSGEIVMRTEKKQHKNTVTTRMVSSIIFNAIFFTRRRKLSFNKVRLKTD